MFVVVWGGWGGGGMQSRTKTSRRNESHECLGVLRVDLTAGGVSLLWAGQLGLISSQVVKQHQLPRSQLPVQERLCLLPQPNNKHKHILHQTCPKPQNSPANVFMLSRSHFYVGISLKSH